MDSYTRTQQCYSIYIRQLCVDIGCSLEDLLGAMDDWDRWQENVRQDLMILVDARTHTHTHTHIYIYIYIHTHTHARAENL